MHTRHLRGQLGQRQAPVAPAGGPLPRPCGQRLANKATRPAVGLAVNTARSHSTSEKMLGKM